MWRRNLWLAGKRSALAVAARAPASLALILRRLVAAASVAAATLDLSRVVQFDIPAQTLGSCLAAVFRAGATSGDRGKPAGGIRERAAPERGVYARRCTESAPGGFRPHVSHGGKRRDCNSRGGLGDDARETVSAARPCRDSTPARVSGSTSGAATRSAARFQADELEPWRTLGEIIVVGTRRLDRSAAETPVPIDQIPRGHDCCSARGTSMSDSSCNSAAPSFNSNRQVGADGADHIDSATLRGLGPDQTLVLVNGKRQHSVALVNVYGSRARGNTGTDLNTIPALAIERIDVLRDGAAAQYGSDAIAGVINIGLKRSRGSMSSLRQASTPRRRPQQPTRSQLWLWRRRARLHESHRGVSAARPLESQRRSVPSASRDRRRRAWRTARCM